MLTFFCSRFPLTCVGIPSFRAADDVPCRSASYIFESQLRAPASFFSSHYFPSALGCPASPHGRFSNTRYSFLTICCSPTKGGKRMCRHVSETFSYDVGTPATSLILGTTPPAVFPLFWLDSSSIAGLAGFFLLFLFCLGHFPPTPSGFFLTTPLFGTLGCFPPKRQDVPSTYPHRSALDCTPHPFFLAQGILLSISPFSEVTAAVYLD